MSDGKKSKLYSKESELLKKIKKSFILLFQGKLLYAVLGFSLFISLLGEFVLDKLIYLDFMTMGIISILSFIVIKLVYLIFNILVIVFLKDIENKTDKSLKKEIIDGIKLYIGIFFNFFKRYWYWAVLSIVGISGSLFLSGSTLVGISSILYSVGSLALLILSFKIIFAFYIGIRENKGSIESIEKSIKITDGEKIKIFFYLLIYGLIAGIFESILSATGFKTASILEKAMTNTSQLDLFMRSFVDNFVSSIILGSGFVFLYLLYVQMNADENKNSKES